jgi:hypothetical protein
VAPIVRARVSVGGTCRIEMAVAIATAGTPPMNTTNMTARSEKSNHTIASGSQAMEGKAWSAVISVPMLRCTATDATIANPISVPTTTATLRPNASRMRLPRAAGSRPSSPVRFEVNAFHTSAGDGSLSGSITPAS